MRKYRQNEFTKGWIFIFHSQSFFKCNWCFIFQAEKKINYRKSLGVSELSSYVVLQRRKHSLWLHKYRTTIVISRFVSIFSMNYYILFQCSHLLFFWCQEPSFIHHNNANHLFKNHARFLASFNSHNCENISLIWL